MSFEIAATAAIGPSAGAGAPVQVGYGVSLTDIGGFQQALSRLEAQPANAGNAVARQLMTPFEWTHVEAFPSIHRLLYAGTLR